MTGNVAMMAEVCTTSEGRSISVTMERSGVRLTLDLPPTRDEEDGEAQSQEAVLLMHMFPRVVSDSLEQWLAQVPSD